jgi:exodeoxyribonuclease-5
LWVDGPLSKANLVCVDEASMVDNQLAADLLSFGVKVLAVGDPYQLPPIRGAGALLGGSTGYLLTEVHRQALGSPIIRMATTVRTGGHLTFGQYGTSAVIRNAAIDDEQLLDADVIIAGTHATRRRVNAHIRQILGYSGPPRVGEKILCTRNARGKGLQNGTVWAVCSVGLADPWFVNLDIVDDRGRTVKVDVLLALFDDDNAQAEDGTTGEQFTWGYCLTCHKAQGSEWAYAIVIDESGAFRADRTKWLYTAVTRAADVVTVVRR